MTKKKYLDKPEFYAFYRDAGPEKLEADLETKSARHSIVIMEVDEYDTRRKVLGKLPKDDHMEHMRLNKERIALGIEIGWLQDMIERKQRIVKQEKLRTESNALQLPKNLRDIFGDK